MDSAIFIFNLFIKNIYKISIVFLFYFSELKNLDKDIFLNIIFL